MLQDIGVQDVQDLFSDIPSHIRRGPMTSLPHAKSELELREFFAQLGDENTINRQWKNFQGGGCYEHYIPSVVNALASRGEFVTAYTPYQAEISQGTLQAIFEFQSMVANLYGMEVSNASMYEGASSAAEAVLMAMRVSRGKHIYVSQAIHPDYRKTIEAYVSDYDVVVHDLPINEQGQTQTTELEEKTACVVVAQPNFYGVIEDLSKYQDLTQDSKAMFIVLNQEALAFGLVPPPGEFGADIVAGEGQSLGNEMNFGGPHVGLFATRSQYVRQMPGRLVGKTVDADGKPGYVLTLSTREQHIRRDKATSNICTNNSLCALKATIYMASVGERGMRELALKNYHLAHQLEQMLTALPGVDRRYKGDFFNEFVVALPMDASVLLKHLQTQKILGGVELSRLGYGKENELLVTVTETKHVQDLQAFASAVQEAL
jgi:glycine dehydrogenase subunit 1